MRKINVLFLGASCVWAFGCSSSSGPKTAPVRGTVTMSGMPMANVGVTFLPEGKGPSASGNTNENGEFTLRTNKPGDGAPLGKHHVVVGNAVEGPRKGPAIPDKYGRFETTDLTAEVTAGEKNVFTFELKP
jgi:hypothetical protein